MACSVLLRLTVLLLSQADPAAAVATSASSTTAHTAPAERALDRGLRHLQEETLDQARAELEAALEAGPYTYADSVELYRSLGVVRAYFDDTEGARWAFTRLLAVAPNAMLPYTTSPRATFQFQAARDAMRAAPALHLRLDAPDVARLDEPIEIAVARMSDPFAQVARVEVRYRRKGEEAFETIEVAPPPIGQRVSVQLPGVAGEQALEDPDGTRKAIVEAGLAAFDEAGWALLPEAAAQGLVEVPVGFDAPGPWYTRWWVWAIAGSVAAAGVGGVVAVLVQPEPTTAPFRYQVVNE